MEPSHAVALEALLFAAGEPLEKRRAAALLGVEPVALDRIADELRQALSGRGVSLADSGGTLELRTSPAAAEAVAALAADEPERELGRAGLETLALVLYRGGATRAEIDWARGVSSGAALRTLLSRGLVERASDAAGRSPRYQATTAALGHLGVARAEDLPRYEELSGMVGGAPAREGSL